eukprot:1700266-Amphidinium_carterae.1
MTIEIFQNAQKKYDANNPPMQNRFFVCLLQHHRERFQNIFLRAGASVESYNQAVVTLIVSCSHMRVRGNIHLFN